MKYFKVALAIATLGCITSAFAGAGVLTTTVTSLQDDVTYAKPALAKSPALTTYIGYSVSIKNAGGNTINNIRFTGTTGTTSSTDPDEKAVFSSADGAYCVPTNDDKTAIECTIGQLTAGRDANFAVFFFAPEDKAPLLNREQREVHRSDLLCGRHWGNQFSPRQFDRGMDLLRFPSA